MNIEAFSDELVKGLLSVLQSRIISIIVYGSVARGTNRPDSDVDVAIIVNGELGLDIQDQLSEIIVDLNLQFDTVFSVIDIDKKTFDKLSNVSPFYKNVINEGVVIWKAA